MGVYLRQDEMEVYLEVKQPSVHDGLRHSRTAKRNFSSIKTWLAFLGSRKAVIHAEEGRSG